MPPSIGGGGAAEPTLAGSSVVGAPPPWLAWAAVALLMAGAVISQIDRMIVNLLVEPVKHAFTLSDTRFAILQSVAFGLFYTCFAVPIGRLADRYSRRVIIAVGIGGFSLCSFASGLAASLNELFLARVGVGIGEASLFPAGFALLSAYFPPARLGRAIACFTMSAMLGTAMAYIFGGALIGWLSSLAAGDPDALLHGLRWWQWAFVGAALPGFLIAPLFLSLPEPARPMGTPAGTVPFAEVARAVARRRALFVPMFLGFSMVTLVSYSLTIWTPALFIRVHGWTPARIGFWFGLLFLVFATSGNLVGGWLTDRLTARGVEDAPLRVAAFGFVGCSVTGALAPLMPGPVATLLLLAPTMFLSSIPYPCAATALQLIVPVRLRAQVGALYLTFINLVGLTIGPLVVGAMTDHLFRAPRDVRYSLAVVVAVAGPAMWLFLRAARAPYRATRGGWSDAG